MSIILTSGTEDLRKAFFALQKPEDIADLLDVKYNRLVYHLHRIPPRQKYKKFQIPKKSGGDRDIYAPITALKIIQKKLSQVLYCVYEPKVSAHGFVRERNVVTNAKMHVGKKYVLNIDLQDFFPSINFGRVRGLFIATPYNLPPKVATVLAQICCFNNHLPQGAPTSPIVSNMICSKLDRQLLRLAQRHRCIYTRYVDDITFSTSMPQFPTDLAQFSERSGQLEAGNELAQIIKANGFQINQQKIRLQTDLRRQEVTGLTINKFPNVQRRYVHQIRAMLHAWEKFGLDCAEREFHTRYDQREHFPQKGKPAIKQVLRGKIEYLGMVRGKQDRIYRQLRDRLLALAPEFTKPQEEVASGNGIAYILTEGKTDWKHLKNALARLQERGLFTELIIDFEQYDDDRPMGNDELLSYCRHISTIQQLRPTICVFDNDNRKITKQVSDEGRDFKDWGNNVYSFVIPVPAHRQVAPPEIPEVSIELYYTDSDIMRMDLKERRLYFSTEFDKQDGKHLTNTNLNCTDFNRIKRPLCIIDDLVWDRTHKNVALPKNDFANHVLDRAENFSDLDVFEFRRIFAIISQIINRNKTDDKGS